MKAGELSAIYWSGKNLGGEGCYCVHYGGAARTIDCDRVNGVNDRN